MPHYIIWLLRHDILFPPQKWHFSVDNTPHYLITHDLVYRHYALDIWFIYTSLTNRHDYAFQLRFARWERLRRPFSPIILRRLMTRWAALFCVLFQDLRRTRPGVSSLFSFTFMSIFEDTYGRHCTEYHIYRFHMGFYCLIIYMRQL